jgi:hypothetical protein
MTTRRGFIGRVMGALAGSVLASTPLAGRWSRSGREQADDRINSIVLERVGDVSCSGGPFTTSCVVVDCLFLSPPAWSKPRDFPSWPPVGDVDA